MGKKRIKWTSLKFRIFALQKTTLTTCKDRDFPCSPVVGAPSFHCGKHGFDPLLRTRILCTAWHSQKRKKKPVRQEID